MIESSNKMHRTLGQFTVSSISYLRLLIREPWTPRPNSIAVCNRLPTRSFPGAPDSLYAMLGDYVWTQMTPHSVTCGQDPATSRHQHHLLLRWMLVGHVMPKVRVRMFATVREAARTSEWSVEARDLPDLLDKLGDKFGDKLDAMLKEYCEDPDRLVILVNGKNAGRGLSSGVSLVDGDEVAIFPPVSGG